MKPGWLTSESHLTAGMVLAGVLIMSGHADPKEKDTLAGMLDRAITKLTGAAAAVLPVLKYLGMRTSLKLRELDDPESAVSDRYCDRPRRARRWQLGPVADQSDAPQAPHDPPRAA